jgi:pyruvate, water dikinase
MTDVPLVLWLSDLSRKDGDKVGGKNASLGEMISNLRKAGIRVPGGFATTATAYWQFIDANELREKISNQLSKLEDDRSNLDAVGKAIRKLIVSGDFPAPLSEAITRGYQDMAAGLEREDPDVAVRSSATAEDLPEASFAGQLETLLNIRGEAALLDAVKRCIASLFTDRAIAYRENHGFDHMKVALSVGVQEMVRSDLAGAGIMFSIDTETGFPRSVLINAVWGLGETAVQGMVDPDEYQVFKPLLEDPSLIPIVEKASGAKARKMIYGKRGEGTLLVDSSEEERFSFVLNDGEILELARGACAIEACYGQPMDMEWAKDGETGELFIVQARPETVQSRKAAGTLKAYRLNKKGKTLLTGLAIGDAIAAGKVCKLESPDQIDRFEKDGVLVTGMTDPDWVPIMKKASAIVTDHGGRTSHAAIVSRELGLTAVVGTGNATEVLEAGTEVTVSCAEGDEGFVYEGVSDFEVREIELGEVPETETKIMVNVANPAAAYRWWRLPSNGVGLARMEFIIGSLIKIHPMALVRFRSARGRGGAPEDRGADPGLSGQEGVFRRDARPWDRAHRRGAPSEPGDRADERLQDQRIRRAHRRPRLRAARGEPDARLARRGTLLRRRLPRRLRPRVPGDPTRARRDRAHQHRGHDPVLPDRRGGGQGARGHGRARPATRPRGARGLRDV